jgi:hypothetical protein
MKKSFFLKGISVLVMVFALMTTGCDEDSEKAAASPQQTTRIPMVTDRLVTGGVMLSWPQILDEYGVYQVWRSGGGQVADILIGSSQSSINLNDDGVYEFFDLTDFNNDIKPNTNYTYTVIALPLMNYYNIGRDIGKWAKSITTGTFPAQGSILAKPANVTFVINSEADKVTVTITPPASGNIPNYYHLELVDVSGGGWSPIDNTYTTQLRSNLYNSSGFEDNGEYLVNVQGIYNYDYSGGYSSNYYQDSEDFRTNKQKYETLFANGFTISDYSFSEGYNPSSNSITAFYTIINFTGSNIYKPGVNYIFQRAKKNAMGNPGAYADVELWDGPTNTDKRIELTFDDLGNPSMSSLLYSTLYDKLPFEEADYQYRIKAVKGSQVEYKTSGDSAVYINYSSYVDASISVSVNGTKDVFGFTPSIPYRNMLKDGDKLVVYHVIRDDETFKTGPFMEDSTISFNKTELERATVNTKSLSITANSLPPDEKYLYVQAYIVFADGTRKGVSSWSGPGLDNASSVGQTNGNDIYQLNY